MTAQTMTTYNSLRTALDLGQIVSQKTIDGTVIDRFVDGSITSQNRVDYYRFVLEKPASLHVEGQNFTRHVHLRLIHDAKAKNHIANGDVIVERTPDSEVALHIEGLGAGVYYLEVTGINQTTSNYTLKLSATAGAARPVVSQLGNTLSNPIIITGQLNGLRVFENLLNGVPNAMHIYQFTLSQAVELTATLNSIKTPGELQLYRAVLGGTQLRHHEAIASIGSNGNAPGKITRDILVPGTYYLQVVNPSMSYSLGYGLELKAVPVLRARMRVHIHEIRALAAFDPRVPFTNWHEADFFGTVIIDGYTHNFGPFADRDIVTNLNFSQVVFNCNQRFIRVKIEVNDEDNSSHDRADIAPDLGVQFLRFDYDTVQQEIIGVDGFRGNYSHDSVVDLRGTGNDWIRDKPRNASSYPAAIRFEISYAPVL